MNIFSFKERIVRFLKRPFYKKQRSQLAEILKDMEGSELTIESVRKEFAHRLIHINEDIIATEVADFSLMLYLLDIKHDGNIKIRPKDNDVTFFAGGHFIANMSYFPVAVHFVEVEEACLCIEGHVCHPSIFKDRCSLEIAHNGTPIEVEFYEAKQELKLGSNIYETRTAYRVRIPLKEQENAIGFFNFFDTVKTTPNWLGLYRFSPVAAVLPGQYAVRGDWMLYVENRVLYCKKVDKAEIEQKEQQFQQNLLQSGKEDAKWAVSLRQEYFERMKEKKKPIWIFLDRIDRADDNAEAMFRYVREKDDVDAYFIIKEGTHDYERLVDLGNVIAANSREHYMLVLMADYILSSQSNGSIENPFWEKAEYVRDLYHQGKIIFLQHGVTKDDQTSTMNKFYSNFYGFVTSTRPESQSILDYPYNYSEENVWLTGMPRFDLLYSNPQKYILLMPSWRKGLMHQVWDDEKKTMVWSVKDGFLESEYVQRYSRLLQHPELLEQCKKYGYKLVFMPHALMEPYIDQFVQNEECIYWDASKSYREAFAEGDLMITDYSSVAFDFAYLKKPILYYQFDKEEFFAGHTYQKGYYDYEKDGFGEVAYEEDALISLLIEYMENNCSIKDEYKNRIENTFAYLDRACCQRVYERIQK